MPSLFAEFAEPEDDDSVQAELTSDKHKIIDIEIRGSILLE